MNEEIRQPQEKPAEKKGDDTHPPVPVVQTEASHEEGPKGTEQGDSTASFQHVSRWARFKKWGTRITVAEAGMLFLTLVIAGSSIVYTKYAKHQWSAMRGQLGEMTKQSTTLQRQLEMLDRPWVEDTVRSASEFTFQQPPGAPGVFSWAITIRTDNVGHSVATAIFPDAKLIATQGADFIDGPRRQAKDLCDKLSQRFEKVKNDPTVWGNVIFPGKAVEFQYGVFMSPAENSTFDGGAHLGKSMSPMLIGCVEYHYATSERPHHTWFVYHLAHTDDPTIPEAARVFFSIGKTVPSANMVLINGGQFAD